MPHHNCIFYTACVTTHHIYIPGGVHADLNLQPRSSAFWTAQLLSAFQGLRGCELYVRAVQTGHAITMQEFTAVLKHRMRGVWRDAELVDPNRHNNKLPTAHVSFLVCHPFLLEMSYADLSTTVSPS